NFLGVGIMVIAIRCVGSSMFLIVEDFLSRVEKALLRKTTGIGHGGEKGPLLVICVLGTTVIAKRKLCHIVVCIIIIHTPDHSTTGIDGLTGRGRTHRPVGRIYKHLVQANNRIFRSGIDVCSAKFILLIDKHRIDIMTAKSTTVIQKPVKLILPFTLGGVIKKRLGLAESKDIDLVFRRWGRNETIAARV